MNGILNLFPTNLSMTNTNPSLILKKCQYGILTGLSKQITELVASNSNTFNHIESILQNQLAEIKKDRGIVNDPFYIKGKGRPLTKCIKGELEPKKLYKHITCKNYGKEGYNRHSCKN